MHSLEMDTCILNALHGIGSKATVLRRLKVSKRNWLIFKRHYGFEDGTSWSCVKLAEYYKISRQGISQIIKAVKDKLRTYARTHA